MNDQARVTSFFDTNVADYETKHYRDEVRSFMTVRQARVLEFVDALKLPQGSAVLDAGCGPGYLMEALSTRGFRLSGIDASERMLEAADARIKKANPGCPIELKVGNIEELPFASESFDLVTSTGVIEYLPGDTKVLEEMSRVLRPGGHLVLPVTNAWSPVNAFDGLIESLKRQEWFRRPLNDVLSRAGHAPILPRHFRVRKHRPSELRRSLAAAQFVLRDQIYFFFLPWPRPLDRFLPGPTASLGRWMEEHWSRSSLGPIAEGYLTVSAKL